MRILIFSIALLVCFFMLRQALKDMGLTAWWRKRRRRAYIRRLCGESLIKNFFQNLKGTYKHLKYYYNNKKGELR